MLSNKALEDIYKVSEQTISKWRNEDALNDESYKPRFINYALNEFE